ncbi:MAG: energy transducer TonB [Bacteroidales bacterium]
MAKEKIKAPPFDEIVFENRNKEYGAYSLRKKYSRHLTIGMIIGIVVTSTAIVGPYINAKALESQKKRAERQVEIQMENIEQPDNLVEPPPPPPPPPPEEAVQQQKYVAPVVVDSVKPEETRQFMTADEARVEVKNEDVSIVEVVEEVQEEVKEEEAPTEVFVVVEEMPSFPGGEQALMEFIYANIQYPEIAKENNIQGRVILRFCVTYKGTVDQVSVIKSVDPSLDNEAIRVIKMLPTWKPGKQGGKPVNVWYSVPVTFQLK